MKTNRFDLWDEEVFVGDKVKAGLSSYLVKYGNFKYFGTERIGLFLENLKNPSDLMPLGQARTLVKIKETDEVYN
jgi:hypothetical protein